MALLCGNHLLGIFQVMIVPSSNHFDVLPMRVLQLV